MSSKSRCSDQIFLRVLEVVQNIRISSIHSSSCIRWPGYQIMSQEDVTFLLRDPRVPNQLLHSKWIKIAVCATQMCVRHNMDVDYLSAKYQVLKIPQSRDRGLYRWKWLPRGWGRIMSPGFRFVVMVRRTPLAWDSVVKNSFESKILTVVRLIQNGRSIKWRNKFLWLDWSH